jgi:hypothetical protein
MVIWEPLRESEVEGVGRRAGEHLMRDPSKSQAGSIPVIEWGG